ncbi:hypothetical protein EG244_05305 [Falsigemmobacter faecalis]|uniref:Mutator family transposase n=1 Tax=Falsigemmobacter faecalis TaxID=2488730 RepID=A0A3P3DR11_9RHOB|nr:hypothetical protein EG244_05305 [Falsigemmobacter faecalis]
MPHTGQDSRGISSLLHLLATRALWPVMADQIWGKLPDLPVHVDATGEGMRAFVPFTARHRATVNPIKRLSGESKGRTDVIGIFPTEAFIRRLAGALRMKQRAEWSFLRGRYRTPAPIRGDPLQPASCAERLIRSDRARATGLSHMTPQYALNRFTALGTPIQAPGA